MTLVTDNGHLRLSLCTLERQREFYMDQMANMNKDYQRALQMNKGRIARELYQRFLLFSARVHEVDAEIDEWRTQRAVPAKLEVVVEEVEREGVDDVDFEAVD